MRKKTSTLLVVCMLLITGLSTPSKAQNSTPAHRSVKGYPYSGTHSKGLSDSKKASLEKWAKSLNITHSVDSLFSQWKQQSLLTSRKKSGKKPSPYQLQKINQENPASGGAHRSKQTAAVKNGATSFKNARTESPLSTILYVDHKIGSSGAQDGSSWQNAYAELADALLFAKDNPQIEQIWVTSGIYKPKYRADNYSGTNSSDRDNAFVMVPNVKIYGGFEGTETSLEERNLSNSNFLGELFGGASLPGNATILSGDFNEDDDLDFANNGENAYHVVISVGVMGTAELNDVTIFGANADTPSFLTINSIDFERSSGAIVIYNSQPALNNVTIRNNNTINGSLALTNSPLKLTNLIIQYNQAESGAAIHAVGSDFILTNSLITNNTTNSASIYLSNASPDIINATITRNTANNSAGGIGVYFSSAPRIKNTILYGNSAPDAPNLKILTGSPSFRNCIVEGSGGSTSWVSSFGTNDGNNLDNNPRFYDAENGLFGLQPNSPAINKGDNDAFDPCAVPDISLISTDLRGIGRIKKYIIDIGAFESLYDILTTDLVPTDGRLYVKKGGAGSMTGDSWANAAPEVADALFAARLNSEIHEIWAAGGIYHPLYRADDLQKNNPSDPMDNYNSFVLVPGVKLYGGFAGNEASLSERNLSLKVNASILSGDFNQNDHLSFEDILGSDNTALEQISDNAYHVVYFATSSSDQTTLDGFTVEGSGIISLLASGGDESGSSLWINESDIPTIAGGAITTFGGNINLTNTIIENNFVFFGGGVISFGSEIQITNSLLHNNLAFAYGGGFTGFFSDATLVNTTVTENVFLLQGAGVYVTAGESTMANSICYNNIGMVEGPLDVYIEGEPGAPILTTANSLVGGSGGSAAWDDLFGIDGGNNLDEDPLFTDVVARDFTLSSCSRAINTGNNAYYQGTKTPNLTSVTKDLAGKTRIYLSQVDMGAYEYQSDPLDAVVPLARSGSESSFAFSTTDSHEFTAPNGNCTVDLVKLQPTSLTGDVTSRVWKDDTVRTFNGAFYLQRHYDIEPQTNPTTSTAIVTLYFTQAEFNAFNAKVSESAYLPTGSLSGEAIRKANLRIYQFHGASSDNSGDPSSYTGAQTTINPDDNDIVWNDELQRWEVSFAVTGFSGFFGGTQSMSPLPVRLVDFKGKLTDNLSVQLDWKVAEQDNIEAYAIEYSSNGKAFSEIGREKATVTPNSNYSYIDAIEHPGSQAFYRLKIIENDGKTAYSRLVTVKLPGKNNITVYPVPAKNEVWVKWMGTASEAASLIDVNGRVLKSITASEAAQKIDISTLPVGIYFVRPEQGGSSVKILKE